MKKKNPKQIPKKKGAMLSPFIFEENNESHKDELYYDAMELLGGGPRENKKALQLLELALKMDVDYVQTHIGLVYAYGAIGDQKKSEEHIIIAYEKTMKKFPKWPKRMPWGILENRAYLRAIQCMGDMFWDNKENKKAIKIFRLMLSLNPNDNQGIRYEIAALYAGMNGEDVNKMFDEGNRNQNWDKLEKLVLNQNLKHKFWTQPKL